MPPLQAEIPEPNNPKQRRFVESTAKRKIARAGRRGGKTFGNSILASRAFCAGRRILYAVPTTDQLHRFWAGVVRIFSRDIDRGVLYKNETNHVIEVPGTEHRIKAKTAWNADTLRGDYCDLLILDEWQLCDEDAWELVGAPMLLDKDGDAVFTYTPPSLKSRSVSKAKDPQHAAKMFKEAKEDTSGRWETFHWTSHDNPDISKNALSEITKDMTSVAHRMEILAEDIDEAPGALWKREDIDKHRVLRAPELTRIVVGVDPSATSTGDEAGIIGAGAGGVRGDDGYVLADESVQGSPLTWATAAVTLYYKLEADRIVAESNQGGEMVETVIHQVDPNVPVTLVHASRGKQVRAEPIAAKYEKGKVHHVGSFPALEDEYCLWVPGDKSPNRLDAAVWALTSLMLGTTPGIAFAGKNRTEETPEEEKPKDPEKEKEKQAVEEKRKADKKTTIQTLQDQRRQRWLRGD